MRYILAILGFTVAVMYVGPLFKPFYYCNDGRLIEDRGLFFGKHQAVEILQGVALTVPCAPGGNSIPRRPKKFDI